MGNSSTTIAEEENEIPWIREASFSPSKRKIGATEDSADRDLFEYQESIEDSKHETSGKKKRSRTKGKKDREKTKERKKSGKERKSKMSEKAEELEESDVKSEVRRESKRVKKVEEYFQWETLKDWEKEMYFEFVKTAKKTWTNNGYDDEEVEKTVLNKISLLRFCIARDFHPEKAFKMWISWVEWRLEYQPHKIKWREVKNSSLNKCFYLCGQNKKGCPLIVICPGATSEVYDIDLMWKLAAYVMEKACRRADRNGTTQMCVIFDRTNMNNGVEKKWLPLYKQLSTLIQDYYPERLHQAYVLHMNWFARVIFQLCKPFIAKKTRNKLIILANQDHLEDHVDTEVYDPRNPHSFKE